MARVLLVDDDAEGLEIRQQVLQLHGHEVWTARNAAEARAAPLPQVVMLDLRLPGVDDGLALIRSFHAAGVRIIVLCGNPADLNGREQAAMVDQVFAKPVRTELLARALANPCI